MHEASSYSVYSGAVIDSAHDVDQVVESFATLFRISHDQAAQFVCNRKLIKKSISESEANIYREKINATGLICVVVENEVPDKSAANDEDQHNEAIAKTVAENRTPPAASKDEPVAAQLVCPKCSCMQPRSEQCTRCDLVFRKYRDPDAREELDDPVAERSADRAVEGSAVVGLFNRHKLFITLAMTTVLLVVVFTFVKAKTGELSGAAGATFVQQSEARAEIFQLMDAAGLSDTFEEMQTGLLTLFSGQLPAQVEDRGGHQQSASYLISMVPATYNAEGGKISLANWLQLAMTDAEVGTLLNAYNSPVHQRANAVSKSRAVGTAVHQSFLTSYERNPPDASRRKALVKLVNVIGLQESMVKLWERSQIITLKLAASTNEAYATAEQQRITQTNIEGVRAMLPMVESPMKDEAVKSLAWQFENYNLTELESLHTALDIPESRKLYSELRRGIENYLDDATSWLVEKSVARVAQGFDGVGE